jgi:hypothetical protein
VEAGGRGGEQCAVDRALVRERKKIKTKPTTITIRILPKTFLFFAGRRRALRKKGSASYMCSTPPPPSKRVVSPGTFFLPVDTMPCFPK